MSRILTKPCAKCPFRADVPNYLRQARRRQIWTSLTVEGAGFPCHATVDYDDDTDGVVTSESKPCAGALKLLLASDRAPGQLARIDMRLDPEGTKRLMDDTTEIRSLKSWLDGGDGPSNEPVKRKRKLRGPCSVVDRGCEHPAGWGSYHGHTSNPDADAEHVCWHCGEPVCSSCSMDTPDVEGADKYTRAHVGERICNNCIDQAFDDVDDVAEFKEIYA